MDAALLPTEADLAGMTPDEEREILALMAKLDTIDTHEMLRGMYPDAGPLRRELYVKHLEFFRLGRNTRERLALCANRVGKTIGMGGYEVVCHMTGEYPTWWQGRRFTRPVRGWAAGDTAQTVRDIIQVALLGPAEARGTGLIPARCLARTTPRAGIPDAVESIYVRHKAGGLSRITLKSYDQKRASFQGTEQDFIWLDEEPPLSIYTECLMRTMTTDGIVMSTFTPLEGLSETVLSFLPEGTIESATKAVVMATWDDAPHLTKAQRDDLWKSIPPYQRDARAKGVPQLGSGAIYPVPESDIVVPSMPIPDHWPRVYALDVGWNRTAAIWGAHDRDAGVWYLYAEHYRGQAEPAVHAEAIKARGTWIPGVIDPAARGRSQHDGQQLRSLYDDLGLDLSSADNSVEAGIYATWEMLSQGRLKVFSTCTSFLSEYRLYRRDEKGKIVKTNDHLMDCARYLVMSGRDRATVKPPDRAGDPTAFPSEFGYAHMTEWGGARYGA